MKKSESKGKGGIVIIIVVLIIVLVIAGIVIGKNKKEKVAENGGLASAEEGVVSGESLDTIDYKNLDNAKIEDGAKINTSSKISDTKKISDNLVLSNIKLEAYNGISNFTADVKNNGGDFAGSNATIRFLNSSGEAYAFLETFIPEIKAGGTNSINAGIIADIVNAYDYVVELHD